LKIADEAAKLADMERFTVTRGRHTIFSNNTYKLHAIYMPRNAQNTRVDGEDVNTLLHGDAFYTLESEIASMIKDAVESE
jgi:hypothetical protein